MNNKDKKKHAGGRPRKYDSPEQMQVAIDDYFAKTTKITICGMALHLGFISRNSLLSYEGYSDEFFGTIKAAKTRVEKYYEEHLVESGAAGSIFALKNFHWSDKQEIDIKVEGQMTFELLPDANSIARQKNNLEKENN